jgi:hypothetical protein
MWSFFMNYLVHIQHASEWTMWRREKTSWNLICEWRDFLVISTKLPLTLALLTFAGKLLNTPPEVSTWTTNRFSCPQDEALTNITRSTLNFVPTTEDDGKSVTCRAENPKVQGLFLETTWKIEVICKFAEDKLNFRFNRGGYEIICIWEKRKP